MSVEWTAASRRKLHGFRSQHKADPADAVLSQDEAWAIIRPLPRQALGKTPADVTAMLDSFKSSEARNH